MSRTRCCPWHLFRTRLFAAATAHGLLVGWTVFGGTSFVPLFVQAVQQTTATVAGATVLAQSMAWVLASVVASRLLLRFNFRTLAVSGMALFVVGSFILSQANAFTPRPLLMVGLALIGTGMGCSMPSFMIAVQATVAHAELGAATSTLQFSRSIGGTLGVSVLGAILTGQLARRLAAAGIAADPASLNAMLNPGQRVSLGGGVDEAMRQALAGALGDVFLVGFFVSILAFGATLLAPKLRLASSQRPVGGDGEGMPAPVGVRRRE